MAHIQIFQDNVVVSNVIVGDGLSLDGALGGCLQPYSNVFVVFDRQIVLKSHYMHELIQEFINKDVPVKAIDATESGKTIETVMEICSWLLDKGADRDALVLAIGGGITTDMAGFAACIYKRGVRYANLPTTLLAQVDAALGGKTGVNHEKYKNILGVICQPQFTYLCPKVLESLSRRDFLSGAAEMLKTFIIEDGGMYERAVAFLKAYAEDSEKTLSDRRKELCELIAAAAAVKAGVVSRDQFEKGERRVLNLGHTFAHAIETLAQKEGCGMLPLNLSEPVTKVTHGEAVAMGIVLAAKLSEKLAGSDVGLIARLNGLFNEPKPGLAAKLEADFQNGGLPVVCPYSMNEMADAMKKDKKVEGRKVHFVVPREIGKVDIVDLKVDEVVKLMK